MDSLFKYSDETLVFTYFSLFGVSAIMLSFLISTFFARAKTAVAVGTLNFLGAFFPYHSVYGESVSMVMKVIMSLLSPIAFALGSINFADYERAHVGLRWSNIWRVSLMLKSIMDTNGPYINDLEMWITTIPTMQYSFTGFLTDEIRKELDVCPRHDDPLSRTESGKSLLDLLVLF